MMPNIARFFVVLILLGGFLWGQSALGEEIKINTDAFPPELVTEILKGKQVLVEQERQAEEMRRAAERKAKADREAAERALSLERAKIEASKSPPDVVRYAMLGQKIGAAMAAAEKEGGYTGENFLESEAGLSILRQLQFELVIGERLAGIVFAFFWLGFNILLFTSYLKHHQVKLMPTGCDANGKPISYELATLIQLTKDGKEKSKFSHLVIWILGNVVFLFVNLITW